MNKLYKIIGTGLLSLTSILGCEQEKQIVNNSTPKEKEIVYRPEPKKKRDYTKHVVKDKKGWEYELKLEADEDTEWDKDKAKKALKVAEYIIKNNNRSPIISEHFLGVNTEIDNEDITKNYRIAITVQEEQDIGFYSGARDVLGIKVTTFEAVGCTLLEKEKISLADDGLDGRVDYGAVIKGDTEKRTKIFNYKTGLEHKEFYQKLYESALDDLIQQFENK